MNLDSAANREIKCRTRVTGAFHDGQSALILVCPICGQELYQNGNSFECRNQFCQFELIETKCPECKKEYVFSRYPLSKLAETKRVDSIGFNMLYEENKLAFKNITEAIIDSENDRLVPICPHCGHNTQNE